MDKTVDGLIKRVRDLEDLRDGLTDAYWKQRKELDDLAGCLRYAENDRALLESLVLRLARVAGSLDVLDDRQHYRLQEILAEPPDSPDVLGEEP